MKNLSLTLGRLSLVLATALSLGACSRAEYTPLAQATTQPASTPVAQASYVPVAAEASATVTATAPVAPVATAPVAAQAAPAAAAPEVAPATPAAKAVTAPKLNQVQRLALRKVAKKLDKLTAQAPQLKKRDASAARGGLDSNLRSAILFGLVGLIVLLFAGVSWIFGTIGTILLIVGLVFLVLWLLDQA